MQEWMKEQQKEWGNDDLNEGRDLDCNLNPLKKINVSFPTLQARQGDRVFLASSQN